MSKEEELLAARREAEESPVAWFAMLERARMDDDFEAAAAAQRKLISLGITVNFHPRRKAVNHASR